MRFLKRLKHRKADRVPTLPTVRAPADRPVPVNPPWRKDFASDEEWLVATKDHFSKLAQFERDRAMKLGIENFEWRFSGGGPFPCSVAQRLNGKVFRYDSPPPEGLPKSCACDHDYCRYCYAKSIIPGFD